MIIFVECPDKKEALSVARMIRREVGGVIGDFDMKYRADTTALLIQQWKSLKEVKNLIYVNKYIYPMTKRLLNHHVNQKFSMSQFEKQLGDEAILLFMKDPSYTRMNDGMSLMVENNCKLTKYECNKKDKFDLVNMIVKTEMLK